MKVRNGNLKADAPSVWHTKEQGFTLIELLDSQSTPPGVTALQGRSTTKNWRKIHAPPRPTETPLMADAMWRGGGPDLTGNGGARPAFNGDWSGVGYEFRHFAMHRHGTGIQVAFFDGSARRVRARNLWQLYWHNSFDINYAGNQGPSFFPAWMKQVIETLPLPVNWNRNRI